MKKTVIKGHGNGEKKIARNMDLNLKIGVQIKKWA